MNEQNGLIWPETVFEALPRKSDAVRLRSEDRSAFGWDYAHAATSPVAAWSVLKDSIDPAEYVLVAYRREVGGEQCRRTRGPYYVRDWTETHDPQFLG